MNNGYTLLSFTKGIKKNKDCSLIENSEFISETTEFLRNAAGKFEGRQRQAKMDNGQQGIEDSEYSDE